MEVTLLYVEGCPHVSLARDRLLRAAELTGTQVELRLEELSTASTDARAKFQGSPTLLIEGADPFPGREGLSGTGCRLYRTDNGLEGAPSVAQLEEALL